MDCFNHINNSGLSGSLKQVMEGKERISSCMPNKMVWGVTALATKPYNLSLIHGRTESTSKTCPLPLHVLKHMRFKRTPRGGGLNN